MTAFTAAQVRAWAAELDNHATLTYFRWSLDHQHLTGLAARMRTYADALDSAAAPELLAPPAGRRGPWWARRFRTAHPQVWEGDQT